MSNNKLIAGGFLFKRGAQYYLAKTNVILVTNQNKDEYIGKDKYETGSMTGKKVLGYYFKELEEPINLEKPNENVIKLDQTVFENFKLQMSKNQEKRWIDEGKRLENGQGARVFYIEVKDEDSKSAVKVKKHYYYKNGELKAINLDDSSNIIYTQIETVCKKFSIDMHAPIKDIPRDKLNIILREIEPRIK